MSVDDFSAPGNADGAPVELASPATDVALWWATLAASDDEVARGERVPASVIHDDLLRVIAELEAEFADKAAASARDSRGH